MPEPPAGDPPGRGRTRAHLQIEKGGEGDLQTGAHAPTTIGAAILVLFCALPAVAASAPFLPDPALTPGYVSSDMRATVCRPRYEAQYRLHQTDLPACWRSTKIVFREYATRRRDRRHYELDDRVPLSLGGRQRLANLWPEPRFGKWNAARKDALEWRVWTLVCRDHRLRLHQGQAIFLASDWTADTSALWRTMLAQSDDAAAQSGRVRAATPAPAGRIGAEERDAERQFRENEGIASVVI